MAFTENQKLSSTFSDFPYIHSAAWGDYDNDGDLDLLLQGSDTSDNSIAKVYTNTGNDFAEYASISDVRGNFTWTDYNKDGNLELLGAGQLYTNTGSGFSEDSQVVASEMKYDVVSSIDYNNDGFVDILVNETDSSHSPIGKLYKNTGNGFVEDIGAGIINGEVSEAIWGDYDRDRDLDILISSRGSGSNYFTKVYNNSDNGFIEDTNIVLPDFTDSLTWGDYNGDGNLDILLMDWNGENLLKAYKNTSSGFTYDTNFSIPNGPAERINWGDYDNDGDLDIMLIRGSIKVYENTGTGFAEDTTGTFPESTFNNAIWGDYDNDGDLDTFFSGTDYTENPEKIIVTTYDSAANNSNTPPTLPTELSATVDGTKIELNWDAATDAQTPSSALSYNIRIGTAPGGVDIIAPMSVVGSEKDGYRQVVELGNAGSNTGWNVNLPEGTYYWSVQAIDGAYAGSKFAPEKSFTVTDTAPPIVTSFVPASGSINEAALDTNLTIQFDEKVTLGTGEIVIKRKSDDSVFERIDIESEKVKLTGNTITVDPAKVLERDTEYYVEIGANAIADGAGNNYVRRSDRLLSFSTTNKLFVTGEDALVVSDVAIESTAWGDYDGDGDLDLLISGQENPGTRFFVDIIGVYENTNNGFEEKFYNPNDNISLPSPSWQDYDKDGDLDIFAAGDIYENTGNSFSTTKLSLAPEISGYFKDWKDYDSDGDLDLLTSEGLYDNTGNGFEKDKKFELPDEVDRAIDAVWGDYNSDGYLDLVLTARDQARKVFTKIYQNTGSSFIEDTSVDLPGIFLNNTTWQDYDGDGDRDLLLQGESVFKLFENLGDGFEEKTDAELGKFTAVDFVVGEDYDRDGDLDLLLQGKNKSGVSMSKLLEKTESGFQENTDLDLGNFATISVGLWQDYDNDGDVDLILQGRDATNTKQIFKTFENKGSGFTENPNVFSFPSEDSQPGYTTSTGLERGWFDRDRDGDLDILATEYRRRNDNIPNPIIYTQAYENFTTTANTPPTAPTNLSAKVKEKSVTFSWEAATDAETPTSELSYNLRVGTTPGGIDVIPPMSFLGGKNDGLRQVAELGNTGTSTSKILNNLTRGETYYWSVQAVDGGFVGSKFAGEGSFTIGGISGSGGNDRLTGTPDSDRLEGKGGNDTLTGGGGSDVLLGGPGRDRLLGRGGKDILDGGRGRDLLIGGADDDIYIIDNKLDVVKETAKKGIDTVESSVSYTLTSNLENLTLSEKKAIVGIGNDENNRIIGNASKNRLFGKKGSDDLAGGGRSDKLVGGRGKDTLKGGSGNDLLSGNNGNDALIGGTGNDILNGGNGRDVMKGGIGRDRLNGGSGSDILNGGGGRDILTGGPGKDRLNGGGGGDRFVFKSNKPFPKASLGVDSLDDFNGDADSIVLDKTTFTAIKSKAANGFSIDAEFETVSDREAAAASDSVIVYNSNSGQLFYNPNGSGSGFGNGGLFAVLSGSPELAAEDFLIQP